MADSGGTRRGLLHALSPEQRARVLAYDGPDAHGDPAFAIAKGLESLPTRVVRLERENERLRAVIRQVADISPKSGGVGQIVRDEMRLWK